MTHPRLFAAVFAITTALTPVGVFASDLPGSFQVASSTFTFAKEQGSSEQLVSRIMGAEVINAKSEKIGAINDLTFSPAGQIDLVVIGVGGFLGIGEKEVAVPYPTLSFDTTKDGERIARTTLTREDLDTAPRYQTRDGFRTGTGGKLLEQAD
ncbi:MAG: PRC-barrel domain-containing protein, partial [Pseudomonadota bacterium]